MSAVADGGEKAAAVIGEKGGTFPLIGVMGELVKVLAATKGHGRVRTVARRMAKLRHDSGVHGCGARRRYCSN